MSVTTPASHACDFNSLSYGSVSPKQVNEATNEPMLTSKLKLRLSEMWQRMMDVGNVSGRDRWGRLWLPVRGILALSDGTKVRNLARITTQKSVETGFRDLWPCSHWQTDLLPIATQLVPLIFTVIGKIRKIVLQNLYVLNHQCCSMSDRDTSGPTLLCVPFLISSWGALQSSNKRHLFISDCILSTRHWWTLQQILYKFSLMILIKE